MPVGFPPAEEADARFTVSFFSMLPAMPIIMETETTPVNAKGRAEEQFGRFTEKPRQMRSAEEPPPVGLLVEQIGALQISVIASRGYEEIADFEDPATKEDTKMIRRTFFLRFALLPVLLLGFATGAAAGNVSYEYGELVVIDRNSGNLKSSTTVYFFHGDGKEIRTHRSENDPRGLASRKAAFKEFIESYTRKPYKTADTSIIAVLNTLGKDGWEMIQFSDARAKCEGNSAPQSTYLFKRQR